MQNGQMLVTIWIVKNQHGLGTFNCKWGLWVFSIVSAIHFHFHMLHSSQWIFPLIRSVQSIFKVYLPLFSNQNLRTVHQWNTFTRCQWAFSRVRFGLFQILSKLIYFYFICYLHFLLVISFISKNSAFPQFQTSEFVSFNVNFLTFSFQKI